MSRNAILANPEHYIFKIFWGSMPPDPQVAQKSFSGLTFPPQTKILDRTLPAMTQPDNLFSSGPCQMA